MRVNINADGRQIEIECPDANITVKDVAAEALGLWRATEDRDTSAPAYGFQSDRRGQADAAPTHLGRWGMGRVDAVGGER